MTLFSLVKPYSRSVLAILFFMLIANAAGLALPWGMKLIIDDALPGGAEKRFHLIMAGLLIALLLRVIFGYFRKYYGFTVGEKMVSDLRKRIYQEIHHKSLLSIKNFSPVQLLTRMTTDIECVRAFVLNEAVDFVYAVLNVVFIFILLLFMNWRLALLAGGIIPVFAAVYLRLFPAAKDCFRSFRESYAGLIERMNEVFNGMNIVRAFSAQEHEKKVFDRHQGHLFETALKAHRLNISLSMAVDFFTSIAILAILFFGGREILAGKMTTGELVAFYAYLMIVFSPLIRIAVINNSCQDVAAALERLSEIFLLQDQPAVAGRVDAKVVTGKVECQNVSFGYDASQMVLRNVSFSVKPGETIAIVGVSGAGKTTLVHLLLRFFDPCEGRILIDGCDLGAIDADDFRKQTAVVLQDDFLFQDTVENNIIYGYRHAPFIDVEKAARAAQAHSFIMGLPQQYQTRIGDRGFRLSSGQRQRIAIARALVRRPRILILDEATSAVDALTENAIQQAVRGFLPGSTLIMIAHRFSTIAGADKIIVLDKGLVLEQGTHGDLLKRTGLYQRLYQEQFRHDDQSAVRDVS
ncbi:MAG: ABC transporter ATP-binding protein [Candidatus Omnitrophota bacterium]